jgi:hypothetical protein
MPHLYRNLTKENNMNIPDFQSSNEAFEFGKTASVDVIPFLYDRRQNYLDSIQIMKMINKDLNVSFLLACKAQFCREAIETIIERRTNE